MNSTFSERKLVVILFFLVLITFSLAQEDSRKMDQFYGKGFPPDTNNLTTFYSLPEHASVGLRSDINTIDSER